MTTERGFRDKVFGGRLYLEAADRRQWRLNIDLLEDHLCVNYKMSVEHGTRNNCDRNMFYRQI